MSVKERQTKSSLGGRNTVPKGNGSTTAETMFVILASYREWAPNPNACRHSYCVLVKQTGRWCAEIQTDDCMPAFDLPEFVPRLLAAEIQADGHGNRSVGRYGLFPPLPIQIAQEEKAVESL